MVILLYLYSNFLYVRISPKEERKIFDFLGLDKSYRKDKDFNEVFKQIKFLALNLNPVFRVKTTELYLKHLGFTKNLSRLLSFDPLEFILRSQELQGMLNQLGAVIDGTFLPDKKEQINVDIAA